MNKFNKYIIIVFYTLCHAISHTKEFILNIQKNIFSAEALLNLCIIYFWLKFMIAWSFKIFLTFKFILQFEKIIYQWWDRNIYKRK